MLIGDEMHNLGAPSFLNHAPTGFQHRLGLSATPVRQYDTDGTDRYLSSLVRRYSSSRLAMRSRPVASCRMSTNCHEFTSTPTRWTAMSSSLKNSHARLHGFRRRA